MLADISVRSAVKAVFSDVMGLANVVGQGVAVGVLWHALMKNGVKNDHVRHIFTLFHRVFDASKVPWVVKWGKRAYLLDLFDDAFINDHRAKKALAAMHYPVSDAVKLA